jgi:hypothetical protein
MSLPELAAVPGHGRKQRKDRIIIFKNPFLLCLPCGLCEIYILDCGDAAPWLEKNK